MSKKKIIKVNCPTCKAPTVYGEENEFRPFCSDRCRVSDTADWADEKFRVASESSMEMDIDMEMELADLSDTKFIN